MGPTIVLAVQAAIAGVTPPPAPIDLDAPVRPLRCPEQGDAIVVCGKRPGEEQRLIRRDPRIGGEGVPRAEMRLFGDVKGAIDTEAVALPQGAQSNRVMVRLKMPF